METPAGHYGDILEEIPTTDRSHGNEIHTAITARSIAALGPNSILGVPPPKIHQSERDLPRQDRIHLSRLRCGHHPALQAYQHRINSNNPPECPNCGTQPHTVIHVMEECEEFLWSHMEECEENCARNRRCSGFMGGAGTVDRLPPGHRSPRPEVTGANQQQQLARLISLLTFWLSIAG